MKLVLSAWLQLVFARKAGIMRGTLTAVGAGVMWFIIYSSYALAFWYGVKLIMDDRLEQESAQGPPRGVVSCRVGQQYH